MLPDPRGTMARRSRPDESDEAVKTRVIFYLLGGVLVLGAGISSTVSSGVSVPNVITIVLGVVVLALAGWQFSRSYGADARDRDVEPPR